MVIQILCYIVMDDSSNLNTYARIQVYLLVESLTIVTAESLQRQFDNNCVIGFRGLFISTMNQER